MKPGNVWNIYFFMSSTPNKLQKLNEKFEFILQFLDFEALVSDGSKFHELQNQCYMRCKLSQLELYLKKVN